MILRPIVAALLAGVFGTGVGAYAQDISASAYREISAILLEKESRTAVQRKLSSSLLRAGNGARGVLTAKIDDSGYAVNTLHMGIHGALVRIQGTVSANLLGTIEQMGGRVIYSSAAEGSIQARVPLRYMEALAARSDVRSIKATIPPKLNAALRRAPRPRRLDQSLGLSFFMGSLTTQGVITHGARTATQTYGVNGTGVRVGVLADSAESLSMLDRNGRSASRNANVADMIRF